MSDVASDGVSADVAARLAAATHVVLFGNTGPHPSDVCTARQYRTALRRVYARPVADRIWAEQVTLGLGRSSFAWADEHLLPIALLSPGHRERVRRKRGWTHKQLRARMAAFRRAAHKVRPASLGA